MRLPFPQYHLFALLDTYGDHTAPMDVCMHRYFRENKAIGSHDKRFIAENAYGMIRYKGLLDAIAGEDADWPELFEAWQQLEHMTPEQLAEFPTHIQVSCPELLWNWLLDSFDEEKAKELCCINNTQAPTTVRVNLLKTTRQDLMDKWKDEYQIRACEHSPNGITFEKRANFFHLAEFGQGCFEVQDEGSQLLSDMVQAKPGDHVLDYCSGSGGKTLGFAHRLEGKGQIYLHDIREHALQEAKKRLRRAGIQNSQLVPADSRLLRRMKKHMDWVLVDAPCSGTGTLRRNPDMKWKYDPETISRLVSTQREIFERALSFVKPGGKIVYATCSILLDENQRQVEHFLRTYPITQDGEVFQSLPSEGGMDGFFGVVFTKAT